MPSNKLKSFPVQIQKTNKGVLVSRGNSEIEIAGEGAAEAVVMVIMSTTEDGATKEEILDLFSLEERKTAEDLLEVLYSRGMIAADGDPLFQKNERKETPTDVFFWNFGLNADRASELVNEKAVYVVGVNFITQQLLSTFQASGMKNYEVFDHPLLRNTQFFSEGGILEAEKFFPGSRKPLSGLSELEKIDASEAGCVVAASDFGGQLLLREINELCVKKNVLFLPVVLDKCIGSVGPLVVPGETACLECLRARENANMIDPELERLREYGASSGQAVAGFHPAMASILGNIASMEIAKFLAKALPWRIGQIVEVNLLGLKMQTRKVLKMPRCNVCGPMSGKPIISPLKQPFAVKNYEDYIAK